MVENKKAPEKEQDVRTKIESPWTVSFRRLKKNKMALVSLIILVVLSTFAIIAPVVTPFHYNEGNMPAGNMPWRLDVYEYDWELPEEGVSGSYITVRPNDHTIHFLDDNGKFVFKEEQKSQVSTADDPEMKRVYLSLHDEVEPSTFTVKSDVTGKTYMFRGDDFTLREVIQVEGNFMDFVADIESVEYDFENAYAKYEAHGDVIEVNFADSVNPTFIVNGLEYLLNEDLSFHSIKVNDTTYYTIRDDKEVAIVNVDGETVTVTERVAPVEVNAEEQYVRYEINGDVIELAQKKMGLKTVSVITYNGTVHNEESANRRTDALEEEDISDSVSAEYKQLQKDHDKFNKLADRKKTYAIYHMNGQEMFVDWSEEDEKDLITITADGELLEQEKQGNKSYILGTDKIGRCIYTRLVYGGRISLSVGLVATTINVFLGLLIGSISGYYGGMIDSIIMRLTEVVMAFPFLLICITMSVILGPSIYNVMLIIGLLGWPGISRMIRAQILSLREQEFMEAATALGIKDSNKITRHLWPNVMAMIIVYATLGMSGAILSEAGLSFLGLGVQPPKASWGNMLSNLTQKQIESMPWLWIPAGLAIFVTVMSFNILGDGLRDALDPKLKK